MQPISLLCSQYQHFPGHVPSFLSLFFSGQRIGQREGNWFDPLVKRSGDCRKWDNGINELLCSRTEGTLIKLRWDARHDKPAGVLDHVPEASLKLPFPSFLFFLFFHPPPRLPTPPRLGYLASGAQARNFLSYENESWQRVGQRSTDDASSDLWPSLSRLFPIVLNDITL